MKETELLEAIKKNPGDTRTYHALAKHYVKQGKWREALQVYKTRLDLPEQDAEVTINELTETYLLLAVLKSALRKPLSYPHLEPLSYHDVEELLIKVCIKRGALYYQQQLGLEGRRDITFAIQELEKKQALTDTQRVLLADAYMVHAERHLEKSGEDKKRLLKAISDYTAAINSMAQCSQLSGLDNARLQNYHDRRLAVLNQDIANDYSKTEVDELLIKALLERGQFYLKQLESDDQNLEKWGEKATQDLTRANNLLAGIAIGKFSVAFFPNSNRTNHAKTLLEITKSLLRVYLICARHHKEANNQEAASQAFALADAEYIDLIDIIDILNKGAFREQNKVAPDPLAAFDSPPALKRRKLN